MNFGKHATDWAMRGPPVRSKGGSSRSKRLGMKLWLRLNFSVKHRKKNGM